MTLTSRIADRFAAARPGFRLLAREPAVMPMYVLTAPSLLLARQEMGPIEQFIIQSVDSGLETTDSIGTFLGLEEQLVRRYVTALWQEDILELAPGGGGRTLRLTAGGERALDDAVQATPVEDDLPIVFDRIQWKPSRRHPSTLLAPRDARDRGLLMVRPIRQSRPELEDLPIKQATEAVRASMRNSLGNASVLVIKRIDRAEQWYLEVDLLIYQSADGQEHAVDVVVDGRLDPELSAGLDAVGGVAHLGLKFEEVSERDAADVTKLAQVVEGRIGKVASLEEVQATRAAANPPITPGLDDVGEELDAAAVLQAPEQDLEQHVPRFMDTYEHAEFFAEACLEAERRLLVISPWIKGGVVNADFVRSLDTLAKRGVTIHIGYGISRDAEGCDPWAVDKLVKLAKRYPEKVTLGILGNTHSKVLIWDDSMIVTSFNWLSFRGDIDRTYRQENGVLISGHPEVVEAPYQQFRELIEKAPRPTLSR